MMSANLSRCITLIDMDCFYVQVEQRLDPHFNGQPCVVVVKGLKGSCIAVSYEARAFGIKTGTRVEQALKMCPDLHLFHVPELRGKADITRYRQTSSEILDIMCQFCSCVERASIDEAFLDLTEEVHRRIENGYDHINASDLPATFIAGYEMEDPTPDGTQVTDKRTVTLDDFIKNLPGVQDPSFHLLVCAVIVEEIRQAIRMQMGIRCSAGIAHNKILAKLACGMNKPNRQTVIPMSLVPKVFATTPISKVRNLGGKLGDEVKEKLAVEYMGDLIKFTQSQLQQMFGDKSGLWLYNIARGIDSDPVVSRQLPKSIGCGKNFPGKSYLRTRSQVQHWLHLLVDELIERLERDSTDNRRIAKLLTVNVKHAGNLISGMLSKSCAIHTYDASKVYHDAFNLVQQFRKEDVKDPDAWNPPILNMSISASKFQDELFPSTVTIKNFFSKSDKSTIGKASTSLNDTTVIQSDKKFESNVSNRITHKEVEGIKKFFSNSHTNTEESSNNVIEAVSNKIIQQEDLISVDVPAEKEDTEKFVINFDQVVDAEVKYTSKSEEKKSSNVVSTKEHANMFDIDLEQDQSKLTSGSTQKEGLILLPETHCNTKKNIEGSENMPSTSTSFFKSYLKKNPPSAPSTSSKSHNNEESCLNEMNRLLDEDALTGDYHSPEVFTVADGGDNNEQFLCDDSNISIESGEFKLATVALKQKDRKSEDQTVPTSSSSRYDVTTISSNEISNVCDRCGKTILVWESQEHADFHFAEDLENSSSQPAPMYQPTGNKQQASKTTGSNSKSKRKKQGKMSAADKKPKSETKTIDTYFQKQ